MAELKTGWHCECGAQESEPIGGGRWRCTGCGKITGLEHDERVTFKKFWDNVNTAIRYVLGLLLFGVVLGFATMAIREANEPPSAATMTEVWFIYTLPCRGECLPPTFRTFRRQRIPVRKRARLPAMR